MLPVIAKSRKGLGNRLWCVLHCLAHSPAARVYWPLNKLCKCSWGDLFVNDMEVSDEPQEYDSAVLQGRYEHSQRYELVPEDARRRYVDAANRLQAHPQVVAAVRAMLPEVARAVATVSVRTWCEVPDTPMARTFSLARLYEEIDAHVPSGRFFLTCDNAKTAEAVIEHYGERAICSPKRTTWGDRTTAKGMRDILTDLYLGGVPRTLLASHRSTFSELQWWFGGARARVVKIGMWVPEIDRLGIDVVSGCQLHCLACPGGALRRPIQIMPLPVLTRCLARIDLPVRLLRLFNFGEPLLHPQLADVIRMVYEWGRAEEIEVSTNAQCEIPDDLRAAIGSGMLTRFVVSCDGDGTPEEYARLRPPASWEKLLRTLRTVADIREATGLPLDFVARICQRRGDDKGRWRKLLKPYGCTPQFRAYQRFPQAAENLSGRGARHRGPCWYVRKPVLYVDAGGTAVPCCVHPRAFVLGSLLKLSATALLQRKRHYVHYMRTRGRKGVCCDCGR